MKTTVEIDDPLFIAAKKRAAELRVPMRVLIERGLRQQLSGTQKFMSLRDGSSTAGSLPPEVEFLRGLLKGSKVDESDYKKHLEEKYL